MLPMTAVSKRGESVLPFPSLRREYGQMVSGRQTDNA